MKRLIVISCLLFATSAVAAGNGAIDFSLPDLNGKIHTLSQYKGKWVIVNYWSTACAPCLKEIPELVKFHARHKDRDAVVLGVDFEEIRLSWLKDFAESMSMNYPVLRSDPSRATPFGYVVALPTSFIIAPSGKPSARQVGPLTAADLEAYIARENHAVPSTVRDTRIR